jgi:16S rRNA (guanine527-N7)-methyltransferase
MELLQKYFPGITPSQKQKFLAFETIFKEWNQKINLVSRKDIAYYQERHLMHSLAIANIIQFKEGTKVMDLGTGGGFPGIPLAIMFPKAKFSLIDSIHKKIRAVENMIQELELENCQAKCLRVEKDKGKYDFILGRAVKTLPVVFNWVKDRVSKNNFNSLENGLLYLKGGDITDELLQLKSHYRIYELSNFFDEDFFETKKVVHIFQK